MSLAAKLDSLEKDAGLVWSGLIFRIVYDGAVRIRPVGRHCTLQKILVARVPVSVPSIVPSTEHVLLSRLDRAVLGSRTRARGVVEYGVETVSSSGHNLYQDSRSTSIGRGKRRLQPFPTG